MPSIVTVNVSVAQAPTPSTLQQTGAFISQGGTGEAPNALILVTSLNDVVNSLANGQAIATATFANNLVTITTVAVHDLTINSTYSITLTGFTPTAYNGTFQCIATGTNTFTYSTASNPGTLTTAGFWQSASVNELTAMGTTFFAQGGAQSVYILELGMTTTNAAVGVLQTWINNNPLHVYGFLVPRLWDGNAAFLALASQYESPTGKLYFWTTTNETTYGAYLPTMKSIIAMVEAPTVDPNGTTEFSLAASFYHALNYSPSSSNKVAPFAFSFTYGVTDYPTPNNGTLLTQLFNSHINVIQSGAQGGVTQDYIYPGVTMDGRDFLYWYSVDYTQINAALVLANEVINGSNNPVNPLYYNQDGINRLQARLAQLMSNEITYGLAVGSVVQTELAAPAFTQQLNDNAFSAQAVVNAEPFVQYSLENPSDYKIGKYGGFSIIYIPSRGFISIVLQVVVEDFITF